MIHCFYHSADLDGHCSGAIVKYRFPEAVMHPINYGDAFPWDEIHPEDEVYMVDFALQPFEEMSKIWDKGTTLIWIDHHKSAIDSYYKWYHNPGVDALDYMKFEGERDITKAACELTWEYLCPDKPVPLAVKLLSLYDSWTYQGHELEDMVLPFQMRLRMEELDPKDWGDYEEEGDPAYWWIQRLLRSDNVGTFWLKPLIEEGRLLLRYDEANKAKYARTYAFETELISPMPLGSKLKPLIIFKAIAVNLGQTNSKVFDSVWRRECPVCEGNGVGFDGDNTESVIDCPKCRGDGYIEPYDLMITFVRRKDKLWNVSLYSTKLEIDCGEIAKSFGGGGHKGAAGFQCEDLPFEI